MLNATWDAADRRIVAIGINPSIATTGKSDITMTKLCRFVDMYGFNNVTMLNLFENVTTKQSDISKLTTTDFKKHLKLLDEAEIILIVWGRTKKYQKNIEDLKPVLGKYQDKLYCIARRNSSGEYIYPLHPSRVPYSADIIKYNLY
ncbi:MAG: DUF1643 domain-containing protein [Pseudobutyrivibrio sp.]|nr:DUF1643 domain-containing protein [Pseudobutyrivibrio sp.]